MSCWLLLRRYGGNPQTAFYFCISSVIVSYVRMHQLKGTVQIFLHHIWINKYHQFVPFTVHFLQCFSFRKKSENTVLCIQFSKRLEQCDIKLVYSEFSTLSRLNLLFLIPFPRPGQNCIFLTPKWSFLETEQCCKPSEGRRLCGNKEDDI